jgi:hypothetical protein
MAATGFMLWNPLITTSFLPGQFIPAAKAAHGGEAILAVLAIIVWHFYNVHIKAFNKSMFTGKLTRHQMEEEHGNELNLLLAGEMRPVPALRAMRRRMLLFIPIGIGIAATGLGTIYWAATAETTAISTLPAILHPGVSGPASTPASPPSRSTIVSAPLIPHAVAGRKQCNLCHGSKEIKPAPADHEGRPVESCQICHRPGPEPKLNQAGAGGETSGNPAPIPHSVEGDIYKDCTQCHGTGKAKPFPANHTSFAVESCKSCHRVGTAPIAEGSGGTGAKRPVCPG